MAKIIFSINRLWDQKSMSIDPKSAEEKFHAGILKYPPAFNQNRISPDDLLLMENLAEDLLSQDIQDLVIIGMGGSSLGAKSIMPLLKFYKKADRNHFVHFWEGSHPELIMEISDRLKKRKSAALFISKSGTTMESRTMLGLYREFFPENPVFFITSHPEKVTDLGANEKNTFSIPENLGGRFSVVSPVGILPGFFAGGDMYSFVKHFNETNEKLDISIPFSDNPAKIAAAQYYNLLTSGYTQPVFWSYTRKLKPFLDWIVQLWAESLGKAAHINAYPGTALGPEDQHSLLQYHIQGPTTLLHTFFHVNSYGARDFVIPGEVKSISAGKTLWKVLHAQMKSIETALTDAKRPVSEFCIPELNLDFMAELFSFWMHTVTYLCYLYDVNPFNQPGVESGKIICKKILTEDSMPDNLNQVFSI